MILTAPTVGAAPSAISPGTAWKSASPCIRPNLDLHHAHVVMTAGDSIRLTQATAGKGVTPLTN